MISDSELKAIRERAEAALKVSPQRWRSMRDGNQYVNTKYMPTAKCVGASYVEGLVRPWNPHAYLAFGFKPEEFERARFLDVVADYIEAVHPATVLRLLDELAAARRLLETQGQTIAEMNVHCSRAEKELAASRSQAEGMEEELRRERQKVVRLEADALAHDGLVSLLERQRNHAESLLLNLAAASQEFVITHGAYKQARRHLCEVMTIDRHERRLMDGECPCWTPRALKADEAAGRHRAD